MPADPRLNEILLQKLQERKHDPALIDAVNKFTRCYMQHDDDKTVEVDKPKE